MNLFMYALMCFVLTISLASSYKHVIFMHGLYGGTSEFDFFQKWIDKDHPGTNVTVIDMFTFFESFSNLRHQAELISRKMSAVMQAHPEGVHLLCYSQGGLLCRGIVEMLDNHNVDTMISLSSPQGGQYGDTSVLKHLFPAYLKKTLYKVFYTELGQEMSIANYWNDPHHQELYLKYSQFLAVINNQSYNPNSQEYMRNFLRLKQLVLIGGPDDGVITPWQSSQFGAFNDKEEVVEMRNQQWYKADSFGLKTLDERKVLRFHTVPGVNHFNWHKNYTIWECCIKQYLT